MAKQVKCPRCQEMMNKEDGIEYKKRYYHEDCLSEWRQDVESRHDLIEYICETYKLDAPTGMILKQINDYQTEYGYKLRGIHLALKYFYETQGNTVQPGTGIGIVPYVYEEAKRHYIMKMKVQESVDRYEQVDAPIKIEVDLSKKRKPVKQLIDISSL